MSEKPVRQKYFVPREIRFSIAVIILWSLLVAALFTFISRELSRMVGHSSLFFVFVVLGYIAIVIILTLHFSHRLVGPFQRLKTEMRLIMSGEYRRRLNVREKDDIYITSFIAEANKMLDELEKLHNCKENILNSIDSELLDIMSLLEESEPSKEKLKEALLTFHGKIKSLERQG